ncbi:MAG: hypothetical protein INQ03_17035 [Candidatus Heimdallarchaeota archaeon]|nr:hypothetical protein [Candidatus Heimdallarchaeota archaeon]
MALGNSVHIVRGVTNFEETVPFYEKLGFKLLEKGNSPTNFALYTDGVVNYVISEDKFTYTGLIYFTSDISEKIQFVEESGITFFWKDEEEGKINQAMFEVVEEIFGINLVNKIYNEKSQPSGKSIVEFGKLGELAVPVKDYGEIKKKVNDLGFKTTHQSDGSDGWYPWGIFQDGLITIGLHQTQDFEFPVPTYFAENMDEILPQLQNKGIELEGLSGGIAKGNAKVTAPDGQIFFLFKGKV